MMRSSSGSSASTDPVKNHNQSNNRFDDDDDDDDDEDGDVCRICRYPGDIDNRLHYPCACRGSIKFVHQDCLLLWFNYSNARRREVCKHPYSFSPVYARVPLQEFIIGIAMKAYHVLQLQFFTRLAFVLSVWLLIIPFITFLIWRLSFVTTFYEAQKLFTTTSILTDCLLGFLLSASIFFIFLRATSLRGYFRHLRELGGPEGDNREDEGQRNGARVQQVNQNIVGGPGQIIRRIATRVEDVPFDELVGMQGPVFHLAENAFTILASNMIFLGVVVLVPFHTGRFILYHLSWILSSATSPMLSTVVPLTQHALSLANITLTAVTNLTTETNLSETINLSSTRLNESTTAQIPVDFFKGGLNPSDATTLAVGYIFIFSIIIFYLGIIGLVGYMRGEREPFIIGRFISILETIPSVFRQFISAMRHLMTILKVALRLVIEFWFSPLMRGWWLDVSTRRMFGKSVGQRVDFISIFPLANSLIHWVVGIVFTLQISMYISLLHEVLRKGVLYFLRDPADPNFNPIRVSIDDPVHKHAFKVLLSVAFFGTLIVLLVFMPVKLAMRMAPSIFPLDISVSDPFTAGMIFFQICVLFAVDVFKLHATIKSLLHYWFTAAGWALGLSDYLLPKNDNFDQQSDSERYLFVVRIILLVLAGWVTSLVVNSALIVAPVYLGRMLFNAITIECNDVYSFVIGSYVIWTVLAGIRCCIDQMVQIRTKRGLVLQGQIWKLSSVVIKSGVLLWIWIFVIPVLIGLLFELLVVVPMRVPGDESPVFLVYQDWALGLLFLKIWARLMPLMGASWRMKFERVRVDAFSRVRAFWQLKEIVVPIMMKLLTALCGPYVLARGVFPLFGYPLVVNSAVYRFAWLGCVCLSLICFCGQRFRVWFTNLYNSIRDDRYLIGTRLDNFGER